MPRSDDRVVNKNRQFGSCISAVFKNGTDVKTMDVKTVSVVYKNGTDIKTIDVKLDDHIR